MAAIGSQNAYATTQPIQGDPIGRAMGIVEQNAFKYREEEDAKAKEAKAAEQARLKEIEDLKIDTDFKASGVPLVDRGVFGYGLRARDDVANMQMEMIKNPNMSMAQKAGFKQRIQSHDQMMKYIKQFPEMLTKKITSISEGVAKGEYYKGDEQRILNELKQLEKENYDFLLDKNNEPTLVIYDVNEKGEKIGILKKTPLGSYINELTPRKNFEYDKSINTFTEKIKPMVTATQTGINITKKEQLTPAIVNSVNSHVKYLLDDPNTSSILKEENPNLSPEQLKQKITDDIYARILTKDEQSLDSSMYATNIGAAKDDKKDNATFGVVEVPPELTSAGVKPAKGYKAVSVTGSKPLIKIGDYDLATLSAYTVETMPNGQRSITALIEYPDIKTSKRTAKQELVIRKSNAGQPLNDDEQLELESITKGAEYKKKSVRLTENEAYKLSQQMKLPNVNAMKDAAYVGGESTQEQPTTIQFDSEGNIID
jgi:hypothetical protein